jgi:mRNA interferase MazF
MEVYKGDIFFVDKYSKEIGCGSEQSTGRPAIVVSNDMCNKYSNTIEVVYLTSQEKKPLPTHVEVICQVPSTALCEQICSVSKDRLSSFVRTCTDAEMKKIDEALMISLGIDCNDCTKGLPADDGEKDAQIKQLKYDLKIQTEANEILKGELYSKPDADSVKLTTERDLYKKLYEQLLEKMMA